MKSALIIAIVFVLSACGSNDLRQHLEAEREFHEQDRQDHLDYLENLYSQYDPEYVEDCLYYEDLVCEFE